MGLSGLGSAASALALASRFCLAVHSVLIKTWRPPMSFTNIINLKLFLLFQVFYLLLQLDLGYFLLLLFLKVFFKKLFIYLFLAALGLCCCAQASHCSGFSCCRAQALGARASGVVAHGLWSTGSVFVAHGLSCSVAHGIFPDQGSNLCPLHWQADS